MMQRFVRVSRLIPLTLKQVRFSSYIYNGLKWGEEYPNIDKTLKRTYSAEDLLADVKNKNPKLIHEVQIPYSFKGTKEFKPISLNKVEKRAFDNMVLNEKKVDMPKVLAKLQGYCAQYLKALATGNINTLPPCESNFNVAVQRGLYLLRNAGFQLELRQSPHELKERKLKEQLEIFETMHIMERAKNNALEDYIMSTTYEGRGLLAYMEREKPPEEYEEDAAKREKKRQERRQQEFAEAEARRKEHPDHPSFKGHSTIIPELQVILRIYALYTTSYKLVPLQSGREINLDDYTFQHVAIFENQLRMPPVGALAYNEPEQALEKYRLQEWKLVDFDGGIKGNPLLVERANKGKLYYLNSNCSKDWIEK